MTIPADFEGSNLVLNRPSDMTADTCEPLNVLRTFTQEGHPVVISCWKCTAEELEEINRTGRIWLMSLGTTMPPSAICGVRPFEVS